MTGPLDHISREALQRLSQAGFAVVPIRATQQMIEAAYEAHDRFEDAQEGAWCGLSSAYAAMVAGYAKQAYGRDGG